MLKWMVTAARGQAGDEVSLAEAGDQEPGIFTISRENPLYSVMEEEGDVVTEIVEYRTLESSHSSGYSSADLNTLSLARSKQDARPTKNPVGIPSPIWPKYVGDDGSSGGRNVQIMKERFAQQKLSDDSASSASDGHLNIVTWLQGINLSEARETQCHEDGHVVTRNECHEVSDSDHEYLVPRPLSREPSVTPRDSRDIERVMRQISLAVSRSRGVSSLSRAVARDDLGTYTASLPRPKLKRLGSKEEKKQILRTKEPSQNFQTEDESRTKTFARPKPEGREKRGQRQRPRRTNSGSRVDLSPSRAGARISYYNMYGAPVTPGPVYNSCHSPAFFMAKKENFRMPYFQQQFPSHQSLRYSLLNNVESSDEKKHRRMLGVFCKSVCFILLFLSFIMVLVTVSIFLSKGIKSEVTV